jgi:hypothetical protein
MFDCPKLITRNEGLIIASEIGHAWVCPCCEGDGFTDCRIDWDVEKEINDELASEEIFE